MSEEVTDARTLEYWDNRWATGKTAWHMKEPNQNLVRHAHLLLPPPDKHRIFVPLCGKSLDVLWLYKEGHHVVGVEGLERLVQEYGEEHNLNFQVSSFDWGQLYQTPDHCLMIYVCDFFDFQPNEVGRCDAVWDRASLVAISESDRDRYAGVLRQMLLPQFRYLLAAVDYVPTPEFSGPPCRVTTSTIHELFGDVAVWKLLDADRSEEPHYPSAGGVKILENFFLLTPKCTDR